MANKKSTKTLAIEGLQVGESVLVEAPLAWTKHLYQYYKGQFSLKNKGGRKKKGEFIYLWEVTRK